MAGDNPHHEMLKPIVQDVDRIETMPVLCAILDLDESLRADRRCKHFGERKCEAAIIEVEDALADI